MGAAYLERIRFAIEQSELQIPSGLSTADHYDEEDLRIRLFQEVLDRKLSYYPTWQ